MASLANQTISSTYDGLIKTATDQPVPASGVQLLEDGLGNSLSVSIGRVGNGLEVSGSVTATSFIGDGSQLTGISVSPTLDDVTTNGSTTTNSITVGNVTATSFIKSGGTSAQFLKADGTVDSSTYLTSFTETNDLTAAVVWANVPDVNITQTSVTQHQAALSITESQISDLQAYLTAESDTLDSVTTRGATTTNAVTVGALTASSIIKSGGTASQFLKADGSVDSSVYLTSYTETDTLDSVTGRGASTANAVTVGGATVNGNLSVTGTIADSSGDVGTSGQILSSTGTGTNWIAAPTGGGGTTYTIQEISTNTTAQKDYLYVMRASLTLTLPASPSVGDKVAVANMSGTITPVVARNGNLIAGLAEDMTIDVDSISVEFIYSGANEGWILFVDSILGYTSTTNVNGSGTTNYISKWSATDTLTDSVIYDNGTNVGIGTSSPDAAIHANVSTAGANIAKFSDPNNRALIIEGSVEGMKIITTEESDETDSDRALIFQRGNVETMRISSTGRVGIGTSSPSTPLHLAQGAANTFFTLEAYAATQGATAGINVAREQLSGSESNLTFWTNTGSALTSKMAITSTGNVGIGTSSPANYAGYTNVVIDNTSGGNIDLNVAGTRTLALTSTSTAAYVAAVANIPLVLSTNNLERMRILPTGGLTFNGDTAAANALDDYEEGTWTSSISGLTNLTGTPVLSLATYTKIGSLVCLEGRITGLSTVASGTVTALIFNPPFNQNTNLVASVGGVRVSQTQSSIGFIQDTSGSDTTRFSIVIPADLQFSGATAVIYDFSLTYRTS